MCERDITKMILDYPRKQSNIACDDGVDNWSRNVSSYGREIVERKIDAMRYPMFRNTLSCVF